jgi:hypothetical protein
MKTKRAGKRLVIELPLQEPRPSASGRTLLVATTHGLRRSSLSVDGKAVWVTANAFYYPDESGDVNTKNLRDELKSRRKGKRERT